jgi:predicted pyridoxine 5'-phosphate oxidase superfamily flavin-nucleotide-binding protein
MENNVMDEKLIAALAELETPKFLATASADGTPNIVPVISIEAWDPRTIVFGELMIWKTKKNLELNPKVGISVLTENLNCWTMRGVFEGFERTGEKYDRVSMRDMFRYNAYSGLRNVGVIRVEEVRRVRGMLAPARIAEIALAAASAIGIKYEHTGPMPPQVTEKFSRLKAAKYISYVDRDGYPLALPAPSLFPSGHNALEIGAGALRDFDGVTPDPPVRVAASVITFDPVAYQVKGAINGYENRLGAKIARIDVEEVYSASPILPGKRIDRTEAL